MAKEHPELVIAYMKAMIKVGRWANEHKHAAAVILNRQTFYLDAEHTYEGIKHVDMVPSLSAQNLECIKIGKDFMFSHGYIKNDFDVDEWAAPEFLEQAAMEVLKEEWETKKLEQAPLGRRTRGGRLHGSGSPEKQRQDLQGRTPPDRKRDEISMKVVIVGGVAGGASCAARLRRLDEKAEILMVERGPYVSYANCGLPYHVGGVIPEESSLLVASQQLFRGHFAIDARINCEAISISPERQDRWICATSRRARSRPSPTTSWCCHPAHPRCVRRCPESICPASFRYGPCRTLERFASGSRAARTFCPACTDTRVFSS